MRDVKEEELQGSYFKLTLRVNTMPTNASVYHKLNTGKRRILCWLTSCTLASNLKRIYTDNSLLKYDPLKSVQHDN